MSDIVDYNTQTLHTAVDQLHAFQTQRRIITTQNIELGLHKEKKKQKNFYFKIKKKKKKKILFRNTVMRWNIFVSTF